MLKTTKLMLVAAISSLVLSGCQMSNDGAAAARAAGGPTGVVSPPQVTRAAVAAPREVHFTAFVTGYSYWDNTPAGSASIAKPVIHRRAGGTGTYEDPITIAVGHSINGSRHTMDYPAGTRFYLAGLRKYAIVEDVCGDGNRPQNGPCHTGRDGKPWLDIYVDGARSPRAASDACMSRLTRFHTVIQNPARNYPVVAGPLTESGCRVFPS